MSTFRYEVQAWLCHAFEPSLYDKVIQVSTGFLVCYRLITAVYMNLLDIEKDPVPNEDIYIYDCPCIVRNFKKKRFFSVMSIQRRRLGTLIRDIRRGHQFEVTVRRERFYVFQCRWLAGWRLF